MIRLNRASDVRNLWLQVLALTLFHIHTLPPKLCVGRGGSGSGEGFTRCLSSVGVRGEEARLARAVAESESLLFIRLVAVRVTMIHSFQAPIFEL